MFKVAKDVVKFYSGKKPNTSSETADAMSYKFQTDVQKYDRHNPQNSSDEFYPGSANLNHNSVYTIRSELRKCEGELKKTKEDLKKEKHRYRSLEGTRNKLQTEHRQQKSEIDCLQSELKYLKGVDEDWYDVVQCLRPYAQKRGLPLKDDTIVSYESASEAKVQALQTRLAKERGSHDQNRAVHDQVRSLQNEVQSLQRQLLTKVEKVHVVSDDVFDKDFRNLIAMVKWLSRSVKIAQETNMLEALDNRGLLLDVHDHHWSTRARKKCFIEAWIWSVLLNHVFQTPFTILGEDGAAIADLWGRLFNNKHVRGWPSPSALCESWRCTTVEHAVASMNEETSPETNMKVEGRTTDDALPPGSETAELQVRNAMANEIGTRLAILSMAADFQLIPKIIEAAFTLGLHMSLQRSRLQVTFPYVGDQFDRARMASIADPDGEDIEDGVVAFIVRPGLTKWGDAHGKHFDQRHDIVPSLVQLQTHRQVAVVKPEPM
ncbi:hypothetical protein N0V86_003143 [Didymella sp. IMI 355093]|nr:hypothetical protein N0V86_003143 [Didymella sp. IMI 355093]